MPTTTPAPKSPPPDNKTSSSEGTPPPEESAPKTTEHFYVCERVNDTTHVLDDNETADDAAKNIRNRSKVGGQRSFFIMNVHHVEVDDNSSYEE